MHSWRSLNPSRILAAARALRIVAAPGPAAEEAETAAAAGADARPAEAGSEGPAPRDRASARAFGSARPAR